MRHFRYTARSWDGLTDEGTVEAASLYDFYAEMNERGVKVIKVVDVTGVVDPEPPPPPKRVWPVPVFAVLLASLVAIVAFSWLPLPFQKSMILLPLLLVITLLALLAWRRAQKRPLLAPLMDEQLAYDLDSAPRWLRLFLAVLLAAALGPVAATAGLYGMKAPILILVVQGIFGIGAVVPLLLIGSGLAAAMRGRLN